MAQDYGYFGKGDTGYQQYNTAYRRNHGGGGGGGNGGCGTLLIVGVVVYIILNIVFH